MSKQRTPGQDPDPVDFDAMLNVDPYQQLEGGIARGFVPEGGFVAEGYGPQGSAPEGYGPPVVPKPDEPFQVLCEMLNDEANKVQEKLELYHWLQFCLLGTKPSKAVVMALRNLLHLHSLTPMR